MLKINEICLVIALLLVLFCSPALAIEYKYKEVRDFKTLESFETVQEFEDNFGRYTQECLDNTYGGTGGVPCLIAYDMWERELHIYYKKLRRALNREQKKKLVESQRAWITERDSSAALTSALLDDRYQHMGTMYVLMRAGEWSELNAPIVKNRALLLREWNKSLSLEKYRD